MDTAAARSTPLVSAFGPIYVVEPVSQHTHTAVLLHGRGNTGEEFAEELFDSRLSDQTTLPQNLQGWRWVFPSSRRLWSEVFQEALPAWFDAPSLTDTTAGQDLQAAGIRDSVEHLGPIVADEIARLQGRAENVVLGGISQGAAIAMWTLLSPSVASRGLGAFVGASTWLPFAAELDAWSGQDTTEAGDKSSEAAAFVASMLGPVPRHRLATLAFLGHGVDDAWVDVELGREAKRVLTRLGLRVEWREYSGAEQEGHWLKVPEEVEDIARFLQLQGAPIPHT
ncbi:alpha/beta-hydrolase [Thozetella sp. PMI_491]|nr:alpha/beta-hydrolase [Thozetella sp. PMI_491]